MLHFLTQHGAAKVGNFLTLAVNHTSHISVIAFFLFTHKRKPKKTLTKRGSIATDKILFSIPRMSSIETWHRLQFKLPILSPSFYAKNGIGQLHASISLYYTSNYIYVSMLFKEAFMFRKFWQTHNPFIATLHNQNFDFYTVLFELAAICTQNALKRSRIESEICLNILGEYFCKLYATCHIKRNMSL